jgi:hypothetical protein
MSSRARREAWSGSAGVLARGWRAIVPMALGCVALPGCDEDPARSVKIIARPAASMKAKPARQALSVPIPTWQPEFCPPPPEPTRGAGTFVAKGACNFEQTTPVDCTALNDDFLLSANRPARQGAEVSIFVNVEGYHGPDKYDYVQFHVSVNHPKGPFRWRSLVLLATVGEGERFLQVEPTRLEPLLTNGAGAIEVTGKLMCRTVGGKH